MANIGYIQVNRHCNNACHFCSNPSNGQNISYGEGVILIEDFLSRGYDGIIFTGGEPTLSPDLPRWITYAKEKGIDSRIISNGMMCADRRYVEKLASAGLRLIHFSVYSYNPKIHDFLTATPGSWKRLMLSIGHALENNIEVQINTVINHYNQNHLDTTVQFLVSQFPKIRHFVWNNLDPEMMRKTKTAWSTIPDFPWFHDSLRRAMVFLEQRKKTFRVEKMPLCYIRGFEHTSTETRKIVKSEERIIYFLDFREQVHETDFFHEKPSVCEQCDLNKLCSWVYEYKKFYSSVPVIPQKCSGEEIQEIISKIRK